jgi:hypothetical protein|tara:strand:- start:41 stop:406 length:366 start_codon:yes stop_codon:yes gene_type:complete
MAKKTIKFDAYDEGGGERSIGMIELPGAIVDIDVTFPEGIRYDFTYVSESGKKYLFSGRSSSEIINSAEEFADSPDNDFDVFDTIRVSSGLANYFASEDYAALILLILSGGGPLDELGIFD